MYKSIIEIAPNEVQDTKSLCVCDKCKKTFKAKDALMEKANNVQFQGVLGIKKFTKDVDTWYLVSPCCKETHLFGFDLKK